MRRGPVRVLEGAKGHSPAGGGASVMQLQAVCQPQQLCSSAVWVCLFLLIRGETSSDVHLYLGSVLANSKRFKDLRLEEGSCRQLVNGGSAGMQVA